MTDDSDLSPLDDFPSSRFSAPFDPNIERRKSMDPVKEYIGHKVGAAEKRITEDLKKHIDGRFEELRKHFDAKFKDAFPDGDPHGHRMYHERSIKDADKWARIKGAMVEKFLSGGVWLLLAFLAYAAWEAVKLEVKK